MDKTVTKDTWFVATKDEKVHHGFCPKGTQLSTGLKVEEYFNKSDYEDRLRELNIEPDETLTP